MKTIKEVSELLNVTEMSIKRLIDTKRNHRKILDKLGCYKEKNNYLFNEEGIKYIAYQYMNKIDECLFYVYPDMKHKKVIKNVKKRV